jgi:hypothetical protein
MSLAARRSLLMILLASVIDGDPSLATGTRRLSEWLTQKADTVGQTLCLRDLTTLPPRSSMSFDDPRALRVCHRIAPGPRPYARRAGVVAAVLPGHFVVRLGAGGR